MARKKLLSEGEIRQFMKLANLRPIGQGRLDELGPGMEDEEEVEAAVDLDEPAEEDEPVDLDEPVELDEPAGGEDRAQELVMSISQDLEELADLAGVDVEVSREDDEMDLDEPGPAPEPEQMLPGADEEEPPGGVYESKRRSTKQLTESQIVAEVTKRVNARLKAEQHKEQLAEQLAERIMKRLTK